MSTQEFRILDRSGFVPDIEEDGDDSEVVGLDIQNDMELAFFRQEMAKFEAAWEENEGAPDAPAVLLATNAEDDEDTRPEDVEYWMAVNQEANRIQQEIWDSREDGNDLVFVNEDDDLDDAPDAPRYLLKKNYAR